MELWYDAHHAGVEEHLVVVEGRLKVGPQDGPVELGPGDLVTFAADRPARLRGARDHPRCAC